MDTVNFIGGRYYENFYNYTSVILRACDSTVRGDCKTSNAIADKAATLRMRFFFLNVNFDGTNYNSPLTAYVDTSFNDTFKLGNTLQRLMPIKRNIGLLHNSYLSSTTVTNTLNFFQPEAPRTHVDFTDDGSGIML